MAELLGLDGNRYKSTIPKEKIFTLVMEDDTMRENNIFRDFKIKNLQTSKNIAGTFDHSSTPHI